MLLIPALCCYTTVMHVPSSSRAGKHWIIVDHSCWHENSHGVNRGVLAAQAAAEGYSLSHTHSSIDWTCACVQI